MIWTVRGWPSYLSSNQAKAFLTPCTMIAATWKSEVGGEVGKDVENWSHRENGGGVFPLGMGISP